MKPVRQEHSYGCGVACLAFVLCTDYETVLDMFEKGKYKAENIGFFCKELTSLLNSRNLKYEWKYVKPRIRKRIYSPNVIVFIKRSKKYPVGHYLARCEDKWMDPWINFPSLNIKAGFRKRLSGTAIYAIIPG
ncbi:MAG: hypothetical protein UU67_C0016G0008 [Candidatus Daviesbacteria bacterium GW2011_GWB1_41_5]|uniref:Peptidase C39 domain-containing protein n=1 Tax=Candidatus Daviesbacteria bacterium GW2011_GWB1_41_5 TaxID=1618429 RepID=A0A0G0WLX7_9BACT|nr:MAG: hypothetical protein UU67_C0016G0008 [Candidatus Daviesbacteria bacterium GW2011_GWB1_41_5]